jgi:dimethylhistidine N-methyltransferase
MAMRRAFLEDVLAGLRRPRKRLSCRFFYDERGSRLFDEICRLDEYYLTRTETAIMEQYAHEMADQIDNGVRLVEFGSGSSIKTRFLLDRLSEPVAYVPVDISRKHLYRTAKGLAKDYPHLEVLPVCADFRREFVIPEPKRPATHTAVYFPGSTIGNYLPHEASEILTHTAALTGNGGGLLIGIDLKKDAEILERAYDDAQGVTAEFNLNLLRRMQQELDAELNEEAFEHYSFYNPDAGRVEIYIRSLEEQSIRVAGEVFPFREGELIHTEYSHKYTVEQFAVIAKEAGLTLRKSWTDSNNYFAVLHLVVLE